MHISTVKTIRALAWLVIGLVCCTLPSYGQAISGTVFRDFNGNGIYESIPASGTYAYGELGVMGVVVTAYPATGNPVSVTTSAVGSYTITGLSGPVRLEFTSLSVGDFDAFDGSSSNTSVQFVTAGATANFGVNAPIDYCQPDPKLFINCYVSGAYDGAAKANHTLVGLQYSSTTDPDGNVNGTTAESPTPFSVGPTYTPAKPTPSPLADHQYIGSTYGLAYNRLSKKLYAASYIKAGTSLGPGESTGVIYIVDPNSVNATASYVDLNAVFGANTAGPNPHPSASTDFKDLGDYKTNKVIGLVGLGDLKISNDFSTLYTVNLYDRSLYSIPTTGALTTNTIQRYAIPTTGLSTTAGTCPVGDVRPFGLGIDKAGVVYVGAVCSASSVSTGQDPVTNPGSNYLTGYVWKFQAGTFTLVMSGALNFDRNNGGYTTFDNHIDASPVYDLDWEPWSDLSTPGIYDQPTAAQNEPMLSGIAFDDKGDMILGFRDRLGDCVILYKGFTSSGDILKACKNGSGTWTLENNATCGSETTVGQNNKQGPGGGEFFYADIQGDGLPNSGTGGVFVLPGHTSVLSTATDPVYLNSSGAPIFAPNAGGIQSYNTSTGALTGALNLYETQEVATFSKAAGVGVIAAACDLAPIQIGNRVWKDLNDNGVQDPSEPPLAGIAVTLTGPGLSGTGVTVTTNANGDYYFSNATGTNATGFVYSLTGLISGGAYTLTFPTSASAGALLLSSKPNTATGPNADAIDTDPNAAGVVSFTLAQAGQNNFTYDAAYAAVLPCSLTTSVRSTSCNPATNQYSSTVSVTLTNPVAGTITLTDGPRSLTLTVAANTSGVTGTFNNIPSDGTTHIVSASLAGCGSATATYTAPAACSAVASCCVNILTNGGFETGTFTSNTTLAGLPAVSTNGLILPEWQGFDTPGYWFKYPNNNKALWLQEAAANSTAANCARYEIPVSTCWQVGHTYQVCLKAAAFNPTNSAGGSTVFTAEMETPFRSLYSQTLSTNGATNNDINNLNWTSICFSFTLQAGDDKFYISVAKGTNANPTIGIVMDDVVIIDKTVCSTCTLAATATPTICNSATNQYTVNGTISLTSTSGGTATITDGAITTTVPVAASATSVAYSLTGLTAGVASHTVTVSLPGCGSATATYTAPASCSVAPLCSLSALATAGTCNTATNQYSTTVVVTVTNPGNGSVSITNQGITQILSTSAGFSQNTLTAVFNNLTSNGQPYSILVSSATCGSATATYTAPAACSQTASSPTFALAKTVDLKQVEKGGIVTYTISLTNTSPTTATGLALTDQLSSSAVTLIGSATASVGSFAPGSNGGTWNIASLAGGQVATLTLRVQLNEEGITYNTVTLPGQQTATTCVSVPAHVCANETFQFDLTAPASYSTYQWTKNGVIIPGATSSTYSVTAVGEYSVQATSLGGCPDGSCCPFIVVADPAPSLTAVAVSARCLGQTPQADAAITLVGSSSAAVSYNITKGSSFTAATPLFAQPQNLSAVVGGVLIGGQANPAVAQDYTIRVYSANGCFSDSVVTILPTLCACPPDQCAPFVVKKTKSQGRPVAP
ncbi:SdrD B-like domain-containing protein [Fibrella aquatilis]|uniref:DUF11 domain-containing protein n=1 Tax=Fibrella aquatilis TaxID=2817059 RepID=A0A939G3L1_9BACT|nr:SdrD B-like domain-containing protein [Fibrella aquatilis]MBO0931737.1 DUF11 domain-containing protein [Fibrella aquatilis]